MNVVYGLFYEDDTEIFCVYIGTTKRDTETRLKEHKREARRGKIDKPLYFFLRKRNLIDRIYIETLEVAHDDQTADRWEQDWIDDFRSIGHPLQNGKNGNATVVRPKDTFAELYAKLNEEALTITKNIDIQWSG